METQPDGTKFAARKQRSIFTNPLILASLTIVLLLVGLEWAARQTWFDRVFPYEAHGMSNVLFDIKWQKLQQYVEENGGVDVIFVGHSLVNTGIDPSTIRRQIKLKTGHDLRIFNFGVEGVPLSGSEYIVQLLSETYHPAVIVYVSEIRDFRSGIGDNVTAAICSNSWFQYKMGQENLPGWLIDHSAFVRHFLAYYDWMMSGPYTTLNQFSYRFETMHSDGYEPDHAVSFVSSTALDPGNEKDAFLIQMMSTYSIDADRVLALDNLLQSASAAGTQPLVIEWPFPDSVFATPGGEEAYRLYSETLNSTLAANNAQRLFGMPGEEVAATGRSDRYHLNVTGAHQFSEYLARLFITQRIVGQVIRYLDAGRQ